MFGNLTWVDATLIGFAIILVIVMMAAYISDKLAMRYLERQDEAEFKKHTDSALNVANEEDPQN